MIQQTKKPFSTLPLAVLYTLVRDDMNKKIQEQETYKNE